MTLKRPLCSANHERLRVHNKENKCYCVVGSTAGKVRTVPYLSTCTYCMLLQNNDGKSGGTKSRTTFVMPSSSSTHLYALCALSAIYWAVCSCLRQTLKRLSKNCIGDYFLSIQEHLLYACCLILQSFCSSFFVRSSALLAAFS